jgi:hypothetical protein
MRGQLKAIREDPAGGFPAILKMALGDPLPVDLDQTLTDLDSSDPSRSQAAESAIHTELHMTTEAFRRLLAIRAKEIQLDALKKPTLAEYEEVYGILTSAQKLRVKYSTWKNEEDDPTTGVSYWTALKARLPRWLASAEARADWQRALRLRMRAPIIDPDLIGPLHIKNAFGTATAWLLWVDRSLAVKKQWDALRAAWVAATTPLAGTPLAGLDAILVFSSPTSPQSTSLGITASELLKLDEAQAKGTSIAPRLVQLSLTNEAYSYLVRVAQLATQNQQVLSYEWDAVYAILIEVWKRRTVVAWHDAERKSGITLSPDHFHLPPANPNIVPLPTRPELPAWRASLDAQLDWEDKLQARIDQDKALEDALRQTVDATEELTLPILRDALIDAAPGSSGSLEAKMKAIGDRLLIETRDSGCARTTRVSQAIETLQSLLFSVRTGQLRDTYPNLVLTPGAKATFDDDWVWMGSYSPWRAAMFVFLYPENILLPSLRHESTPAFRKLVKDLRSSGRITPERARQAAQEYTGYFRDVCSLNLEATIIADVRHADGQGPQTKELFLFARSTTSDRVYWCTRDGESKVASTQTFWDEVPGLGNVLKLVGAVEYDITPKYDITPVERFIHLFAQVHDGQNHKLSFVRYDLERGSWLQEQTELVLPNKATNFSEAELLQPKTPTDPPRLRITLLDGSSFTRELSQKGNDWESDDFQSTTRTIQFVKWENSSLAAKGLQSRFSSNFTPQEATRWMKAAHEFARDRGFVTGFPTFQEDGDKIGVYMLTSEAVEPASVLASDLANANPVTSNYTAQDLAVRFAALQVYVRQTFPDYIAGFPTFVDNGPSYGVILVRKTYQQVGVAIVLPVALQDLGKAKSRFLPDFNQKDITQRFIGLDVNWKMLGLTKGREGFPPFFEANGFDDACFINVEQKYKLDLGPTVNAISVDQIKPAYSGPFDITPNRLFGDSATPAQVIRQAYDDNLALPPSLQVYFDEAWYFVPVHIALQLQHNGYYTEALDWFSNVYDYSAPTGQRKVYYGLVAEASLKAVYERGQDWSWLRDPLNPHAIAKGRGKTYTRFTLLSIIRCFLDYADAEFTRDTTESIPMARTLYQTALELLEDPDLNQQVDGCGEIIGQLKTQYGDGLWIEEILPKLNRFEHVGTLRQVQSKIEAIIGSGSSIEQKIARIRDEVEAALQAESQPRLLHEAIQEGEEFAARGSLAVMALPGVSQGASETGSTAVRMFDSAVLNATGKPLDQLEREPLPWLRGGVPPVSPMTTTGPDVDWPRTRPPSLPGSLPLEPRLSPRRDLGSVPGSIPRIGNENDSFSRPIPISDSVAFGLAKLQLARWIPALVLASCIPPNPVLRALHMRAEINLHKIRTCRTIAGVKRELESYAAPTDTSTGMPVIGAGGQLVLPGLGTQTPTPYRYSALIERAKQLVQLAQQVESSMLSALQQRDNEAYNLMKARQDVQLARAGVQLQELRVKEVLDGVTLAQLQEDRASLQVDHYSTLLSEDISGTERAALDALWLTAALNTTIGALAIYNRKYADAASAFLSAGSATGSALSTIASYERRKQDLTFQRALSLQEVRINAQQVQIAGDHVQVTEQEREIAELQTQNAERTVDFLANKFTNAELYDWMAGVLEGVYRYFLQQATAMAKLAASQLAFERQEPPPPFIQADYWEPPTEDGFSGGTIGKAPDRRGLTGSVRLLQDISRLDQYAFDTNKRKLQLGKTLSLVQLAPVEFQRFRETGVMTFATPMEFFDRDFPGHYLRLIRRVKTSVVALIPPEVGIKATLTASRTSRVVIGGDIFQTVRVQHGPDMVALTSPRDATGLFELDIQSDMLAPFESIGVDTTWELRMPKASNPFDYNTIADVLFSIEYTALNSFDYRQEVIQRLRRSISSDRPFSFRQQFADEWYDLHNPEQEVEVKQMVANFETRREDFPPNLVNLTVQHVVLYFARKNGASFEVPVTIHLRFTEQGSAGSVGGPATSLDGVVSTRRGNAGAWMSMLGKTPFGKWELAFPHTEDMKNRFKNEEIEDILFVITYSGDTPEWPA